MNTKFTHVRNSAMTLAACAASVFAANAAEATSPSAMEASSPVATAGSTTLGQLATADQFKIMTSSIADGAVLSKLETDQQLLVTTNMDADIVKMAFVLTDLNPDDPDEAIMRYSYFTKNAEGEGFVFENPKEITLYQGHQYEIKAIAYADEAETQELGSDAITISGDTKAFEFSAVKLVSITPEVDNSGNGVLTDASQRQFVLKFDGKVKLDSRTAINTGFGTSVPFESIAITEGADVDSADGYSDTWTLTVSESFMKATGTSITFFVFANDVEGNVVKGNTGINATSYFMFVYQCAFNASAMAVTPASGAQVEELSSLEFTFPKGVGVGDNFSGQSIEVYNEAGELVATGSQIEDVYEDPDGWDPPYKCIVALDQTITANGKYTVKVPAGMFMLIFDTSCAVTEISAEMNITYDVTGAATADQFKIMTSSIADGAVLSKLETDQQLLVTTNMDADIVKMAFVLTDLNPDDPDEAIMRYSYFTKNAEGEGFVFENPKEITLYQGHQYEIKAIAYADEAETQELGSDAITISGDTKAFEFSAVKFVSITPEVDNSGNGVLTDASQRQFVLKFDGKVKLDSRTAINTGFGTSVPFESIAIAEGADSADGYSDTWTLTVSESFMKATGTSITFFVFANDVEGNVVKGNTGTNATSNFMFVYQCAFNASAMVVTPASGAPVEELSSLEFTFPKGAGIGDNFSGQSIEVYNEAGELVATGSQIEEVYEDPDAWDPPYKCIVALDQTITANGKYTVKVPAGMFMLIHDTMSWDSENSSEMNITYYIGTTGINRVNAAAAAKGIYTTRGVKVDKITAPGLYIVNGIKVMVK